jgi:hypothetical protein
VAAQPADGQEVTMPTGISTLFLRSLLVVACACVFAVDGHAQGGSAPAGKLDKFVGTWVLNLGKSTFEGVAPPKSELRTLDYHGEDTLLNTTTSVNQKDMKSFSHYVVKLDGKDHPEYTRQGGAKAIAAITMKQVDANTLDVRANNFGAYDLTGNVVVSADGKTLTITLRGKNTEGREQHRVRVYDKQ